MVGGEGRTADVLIHRPSSLAKIDLLSMAVFLQRFGEIFQLALVRNPLISAIVEDCGFAIQNKILGDQGQSSRTNLSNHGEDLFFER